MSSQEGPKRTLHVNLRVRALDDVQSPDPGALYFNKKGWFALDQVVIEPGTSPRMSPRSAGSGNSSPSMRGSTSPRSGSAVSSPSGERFPTPSSPSSGGSSPVGSPVPTRNQNRPTAKKLSSFLWKTRDERTTCTPSAGPSPAAISLVQEEQSTAVAEEKKKPSDMIKLRLMWRRSVNEKPAASTECHH